MDRKGSQWISIYFYESQWILMDPNGSQWIPDLTESQWIRMDPNGYKWIQKDPDESP